MPYVTNRAAFVAARMARIVTCRDRHVFGDHESRCLGWASVKIPLRPPFTVDQPRVS